MYYLVLAYPELKSDDFDLIQGYRKLHDKQYSLVRPHFTFVFPVADITEKGFRKEIEMLSSGMKQISFSIESSMVHTDNGCEYYEFLVPSEGYNQIESMHKQLYSGRLEPQLKKEVIFVPHMTIGHSDNEMKSRERLSDFRKSPSPIKGRINSLSLVSCNNASLRHVSTIHLIH